jgi:hypothetical protein
MLLCQVAVLEESNLRVRANLVLDRRVATKTGLRRSLSELPLHVSNKTAETNLEEEQTGCPSLRFKRTSPPKTPSNHPQSVDATP